MSSVVDGGDEDELPKLSRSFKLMLDNAAPIEPRFPGVGTDLGARLDNHDEVVQLARDTSGISAAARVLIGIAAEGKDWVLLEKRRARRRLDAYRRRHEDGEASA